MIWKPIPTYSVLDQPGNLEKNQRICSKGKQMKENSYMIILFLE